jgi:hypothetical protein
MKKILFYGNCQLGALSKHIRSSSADYQILDCQDYGLKQFWADSGLFATWSLENKSNQDEYYAKIIEAVKNCDFFIFQHHKDLVRREELTTQFLMNELNPQSTGICLPSIQYYGYLYDVHGINCVVKNLYEKGARINDIIYYLKNEDDDYARNQIIENHNSSLNKLKQKDEENKQLYENYISISDFIESNYQNKIIAYDHSHPSTHYYNEIIDRLAEYDIKIDKIFDRESILPGSSQLCPYDLKYFNSYFSELEDTKKHDSFFKIRLNEENIKQQIELIKGKIE